MEDEEDIGAFKDYAEEAEGEPQAAEEPKPEPPKEEAKKEAKPTPQAATEHKKIEKRSPTPQK